MFHKKQVRGVETEKQNKNNTKGAKYQRGPKGSQIQNSGYYMVLQERDFFIL